MRGKALSERRVLFVSFWRRNVRPEKQLDSPKELPDSFIRKFPAAGHCCGVASGFDCDIAPPMRFCFSTHGSVWGGVLVPGVDQSRAQLLHQMFPLSLPNELKITGNISSGRRGSSHGGFKLVQPVYSASVAPGLSRNVMEAAMAAH